MKRNIFTLLLLLAVFNISFGHTGYYFNNKNKNNPIASQYQKAWVEFKKNPEDKTAQENYLNSLKALWKDKEEKHKKTTAERYAKATPEQIAFWKAKENLNKAEKAWREDFSSTEKANALLDAQKKLWVAQKAISPILVLNGKVVPSTSNIDYTKVVRGGFIPGEKAVEKYGERARYGAVILKYKTDKAVPQMSDNEKKSLIEMEQRRIDFLAKAIALDEKIKAKFTEIHKEYSNQIGAMYRENKALLEDDDADKSSLDKILRNNIHIEQKRAEMYSALAKILTESQLIKLYKADMDFARWMASGNNNKSNNPQQKGNNSPNKKTGNRTGGNAPRAANPNMR